MNTINIFLKTSGSLAQLEYDFRLYRGAYQNKLIDIYVPKSLLYSNQENTFLNVVKTGGLLTAGNGRTITTNAYYASFICEKTVNNVEYAVFEQTMPKEYTTYAGTQTIVVNVVNIDNTDSEHPATLDVITSQTAQIIVQESAYIGDDEADDPTQLELLAGQMAGKQDKIDPNISVTGTVTSDSVVGAINDLNAQVTTNTDNISTNSGAIDGLDTRVSNLEDAYVGNETPIGTLQTTSMPTTQQLNNFVVTNEGRQPKENDVIIVEVTSGGTLTTYKYYYTNNGWAYYQIASVSKGTNSDYGIIKGSYGEADYVQPISASIQNGQIVGLYYRANGEYVSVATKLATLDTSVTNIINGTQVVGEAEKAQKDAQGNVIATTYAKANDVYTKTQSDAKYLSKNYLNVYYYAEDGLVEEVPTTPASGIQFTANVPTTGEVLLATAERELAGSYSFNSNSTDQSTIWFMTDANCSLTFRMLTYVEKSGVATLISSQVTEELAFENGVPRSIPINAIYSILGTNTIEVGTGDIFRKVIYVTSADNTAVECDLLSSAQYPSSFNLTTTAITIDINTINSMKSVPISSVDWTLGSDGITYSVTITQTQHQQAPSNKYMINVQEEISAGVYENIAVTPTINATTGDITLYSYQALDCVLNIASATAQSSRGIITLTNPTSIPTIDYEQAGALRITQTTTPTALTLNTPENTGKFYTFVVANDSLSTETIDVNGESIVAGTGIQFKWVGSWVIGENPITSSDIYDTVNEQALNQTITETGNNIAELKNIKKNATQIRSIKPQFKKSWVSKTWLMSDDSGALLTYGNDIWSDGNNIYYSDASNQLRLDKTTGKWMNVIWTYPSGLSYILGVYTWNDGVDTYYCANGVTQYILDTATFTWSEVTLTNQPSAFDPKRIWTDGNNIYYDAGSSGAYVFDRTTKEWTAKIWNGVPSNYQDGVLAGQSVWSDGNNIYYNDGDSGLVLDLETSTWKPISWSGLTNAQFNGANIWSDGSDIYVTRGDTYRLDIGSHTWILESSLTIANSYGQYIWTDYDGNIYYSEIYIANIKQYVLKKPVNAKTHLK